jgi:type II secretory pathway pseudopilin PulG
LLPACSPAARRISRRAVTLIETLVAVTIAVMASAALLLAVQSALSTATDATDRTIAEGLAQQLLDEILQKRYAEPGQAANSSVLGPNSGESTRSAFDDTDDYHNYAASPPQAADGLTLGSSDGAGALRPENFRLPDSFFGRWRHSVKVYYLDPSTLQPLASGTSFVRAIEVTIEQKDSSDVYVPLATKRRVIAYVPPATS